VCEPHVGLLKSATVSGLQWILLLGIFRVGRCQGCFLEMYFQRWFLLWADFSDSAWEIGLHLKLVAGSHRETGFTGGNLAFQILRLLGGVFEGGLF